MVHYHIETVRTFDRWQALHDEEDPRTIAGRDADHDPAITCRRRGEWQLSALTW
jgi:hypothetical protein